MERDGAELAFGWIYTPANAQKMPG